MTRRTMSRRHLLATIPGAVILAAGVSCGGDDDDDATPTSAAGASPSAAASAGTITATRLVPAKPSALGAPDVPAATVSTASNAVPHDPAVALYDNYGTTAKWGEFPRTVKHAMGEAKFSKQPSRVVVLDSGEMDSVVTLGVKPVGVLNYDPKTVPSYLLEGIKDAKQVGILAEPDLEAIAALTPDLILTSKIRHEKIFDKLNAIAPAVFGERTGVVWKQNFALHAAALGREQQAAEVVAKYEKSVTDLNAKLPKPRPTTSVVRVLEKDLRYYQRANYSGTILTDLGFPRPASQNVDDFGLLMQSIETLGQSGAADWILVSPTQGPEGKFTKEFLASPVWQSLDAVKKNNFLVVNDDVWMAGIGYNAAATILADIAKYWKV